jgi:hypothetical protein
LYVLHTDVWYWNDPRIVLGLPIGVTYHVLWTLAVTVVFALAVRYAWPEELENVAPTGSGATDSSADPASTDGEKARAS